MSHGLYLYCLREPSGPLPEIRAAGVDGKGGVFIRTFDGIEAVVSEVKGDDFGEMQKKAQEDVQWIKEKALAHEMVVEEAMGKNLMDRNFRVVAGVGDPGPASPRPATGRDGSPNRPKTGCLGAASLPEKIRPFCGPNLSPVIPVKFGVIFTGAERLAETLNRQSAIIKAAFDRIRAKQEWSVKLFLRDVRQFKDDIKKQNEKLRNKSRELAGMPAGMAYFMEEEFNRELEQECSQRLEVTASQTFAELKPFADEATLVKILDSKLTGRSERMVLNSAYLIADSHLPEFEKAVAIMREKIAERGFLVEQGGPWPAYHFTEFSHD